MTRIGGPNGNAPTFGLGIKKETGPELKVGFGSTAPLTFLVKLDGRLMSNARVAFRLKGKTNGASLASDSMTAGDDGMVTVNVTAGSQAADFAVIASSNGKDVGTVRVLVVANVNAAEGKFEVSFASNVPGPIALEVARLMKNDPRAALFLLGEHDPMVKAAISKGMGDTMANLGDALELARSAVS